MIGIVLEEILEETLGICENDVVLTEQLIEVVSKSLDIPEEFIISELQKINSIYTCNNPIEGFIKENGTYKSYRRLTIYTNVKRILEKHLSKYTFSEKTSILQEITYRNRVQHLKFKEI